MTPSSPAGNSSGRSSESGSAAPLAAAPATGQDEQVEKTPLEVGVDLMVDAEGISPEEVLPSPNDRRPRRSLIRNRRVQLPIVLFFITCVSIWFAGATRWMPLQYLFDCIKLQSGEIDFMGLRQVLYAHGWEGLVFMIGVQLILLSHEMGHYLYALYYRVRCTLPIFVPFPIAPTGTMGAVIAMEGHRANRKQIFDIGIAGPIAGLCFAVPVLWLGVRELNLDASPGGGFALDLPLLMRWLVDQVHPGKLGETNHVWLSQSNPFFIAGWFGLFMTALNMLPVSQLDGGHVTYTLWGKGAHWVARAFMVFVFAYIAFTGNSAGSLMAVLVMVIGTDHPPTSDDKVPLGWFRILLGHLSLIIPIICFTPKIIVME
jgi:hypothetical protein